MIILKYFYKIVFLLLFCMSLEVAYANEKNQYTKINKVFLKDSHWHFKLKEVSKDNNMIKVSIRYLNKGSYRRPIFLSQGNTQAITSKNDDGSVTTMPVPNEDIPLALLTSKDGTIKYKAIKVDGILNNSFTFVEAKKGKTANFYFKINDNLKEAYFLSEWVTVIMRGAASVIPINILIKIP